MGGGDSLATMYSDAAFSEGRPISLGWVLFLSGQRPRAGAMEINETLSRQLKERQAMIFIGELLGALSAAYSCRAALQGHRLIHLVGNQSALSALVGGCSPEADASSVACMCQLLLAQLGCRVWFEWVGSDSNIAGGPSRLGLQWVDSPEAEHPARTMESAHLPDLNHLATAPASCH